MSAMQKYLANLSDILSTKFNNNVIPIALVKHQKKPMYCHKTLSNEDAWKKWEASGMKLVADEEADIGLLIRNREIVVVDFDNKEQAKLFEDNIPEFSVTVKQETKKGFHYFFKGTEQSKQMKMSNHVRACGEEIELDIITTWEKDTAGMITVYPSLNKAWVNSILDVEMLPLPQQFIKFYNEKNPKAKKERKQKNAKEPQHNEDKDTENTSMDYELLKEVVMGLSASRAGNFEDWCQVVWAIYNICHQNNIGDNKRNRLIHNFSEQSSDQYDEDRVDTFIYDCSTYVEHGYKIGTLVMFLKEDNKDLYNKLFNPVKMYNEKKKEWEKTHFKVLYPPSFCTIMDDGYVRIQNKKSFKETYDHEECLTTTASGDKKVTFIDLWFKDSTIRRYNYINFLPPPLKCGEDTFNMWNGFHMEKVVCKERGNIDNILEHMRIMVCTNCSRAGEVVRRVVYVSIRPWSR
jgi:hypothetical protein